MIAGERTETSIRRPHLPYRHRCHVVKPAADTSVRGSRKADDLVAEAFRYREVLPKVATSQTSSAILATRETIRGLPSARLCASHVAAVFAADRIQRVGDLAE